jgi:hypothetical protein
MGEDGLEESEQDVHVELGEDQGACDGSESAGESLGVDIATGSGRRFDPVDGDGRGGAFDEGFGLFLLFSFWEGGISTA